MWCSVADESTCLGVVMPVYVLVAAEGQPELRDAPLAEHLEDHSLVDDGTRTSTSAAVLGVVQPPRVAFRHVLAEVVVVRPAGGRESQQQLLERTTVTVVKSGGLTPSPARRREEKRKRKGRTGTCPVVRVRRLGGHVLVQAPPEPGRVGLLGEEELVLLPAREHLDEGAVAGRGHAALDRLPRHDRVPFRRLQRPQVEQLGELEEWKEGIQVKPLAVSLTLVCGFYLVHLVGVGGRQGRGEVLAEPGTVRRPDLLPLGGAPRSQQEAQAPRRAARAADLPARLLGPCSRGHGRRRRLNEVFDVDTGPGRLARPARAAV